MKVYTLREVETHRIVTGRRSVYTRPADAARNKRDVPKGVALELVEYELGVSGERVVDHLVGGGRY